MDPRFSLCLLCYYCIWVQGRKCTRKLQFTVTHVELGDRNLTDTPAIATPDDYKEHCDTTDNEKHQMCDLTVRMSINDKVVLFEHEDDATHSLTSINMAVTHIVPESQESEDVDIDFLDDDCRRWHDTHPPYQCDESTWCKTWRCPFLEGLCTARVSVDLTSAGLRKAAGSCRAGKLQRIVSFKYTTEISDIICETSEPQMPSTETPQEFPTAGVVYKLKTILSICQAGLITIVITCIACGLYKINWRSMMGLLKQANPMRR